MSNQELEAKLRKMIYCSGNCGPQMTQDEIKVFVEECVKVGEERTDLLPWWKRGGH